MGTLGLARALAAALVLSIAAADAAGQAIERPADERPELAPFEAPAAGSPLVLPPPPEPPPTREPLERGLRVFVRRVRVEGSTVFSGEELDALTRPWALRRLDSGDLQDLTDAVTRLYVEGGYPSSGAWIPDQDLEAGVLVVRVIEARLVDVRIEGNRWYRDAWLRARLMSAIDSPVSVRQVEEQLQLLLQEPDFVRVRGSLRPGPGRGEDVLELRVEERMPFGLGLRVANDNPPAVGGVRGQILAADRSLLGFGDALETRFEFAGGLNAQELRYEAPLLGRGTSLVARFRRSEGNVVEDPFEPAGIESETWSGSLGLRHPLWRTPRQRLWLGFHFDRRRSTTWLDGSRFSFVPGPDNGRSDVTILRLVQEWEWRSPDDVLAARSTVRVGIDALGATTNPGNVPDGRFVAWLAQGQWAHRFPERLLGSQVIARADLQLASDPLLTLEQIAVGGVRTVRGYRENLLVADNAVIASIEVRIPLLREWLGPDALELAPFFDVGHAWNESSSAPRSRTLEGAGVGLLYRFVPYAQLYAYWAAAFRSFPPKSSSNIQDNGFHLGVTFDVF